MVKITAFLYGQSKTDIDSVLGHLKGNLSFTRFLLRGFVPVIKIGSVVIAQNLWALAGFIGQHFLKTDF